MSLIFRSRVQTFYSDVVLANNVEVSSTFTSPKEAKVLPILI